MKFFGILLSTMISVSALAETGTFEIEGMHCKMCVRNIKKTICNLEEIDQCDVEVGKLIVTSKKDQKIDIKKITDLINETEKYKVIKSEVKP